jgi:phage terminase large subunit
MNLVIAAPYPKQREFLRAKAKRIGYGGARGGGKSWAARTKAVLLALKYPGIQILLLRRTLKELRENHVLYLMAQLKGIAAYRDSAKEFLFPNGSRLTLGYCDSERDVIQYQGQAYDVIMMEEATHFTEFQYQTLTESNRVSGLCGEPFSPRMYFTCNPGGVGHGWVKRLFIDRDYQNGERSEDYVMIRARVFDNRFLMENDPEYIRNLENLPEDRRRAMLDGDWDVFSGQYFTEFRRDTHVIKAFDIPKEWRRFITVDYGLDMLACYWIAMDEAGRAYVYRELYEPELRVTQAAERIRALTGEDIHIRYAPPDLWNRHADTGKSTADIFRENGIMLVKAQNDRVQGWYNLKEWLAPFDDEQGKKIAQLRIFENCGNLIRTLPMLRHDEKNVNDCAKEPHELTHAPDAIRYFVAGRPKANAGYKKSVWETEMEEFAGYGN